MCKTYNLLLQQIFGYPANPGLNSYRFIVGNLVANDLCSITELCEALGVNRKNIERYVKTFREKGAGHFFSRKETRGRCHKVTDDLLTELRLCLDNGELGKLIGYDRIPEVKKLRGMTHELTRQQKSESWLETLSGKWIEEETPELYYIDGHVQVYHGYLAFGAKLQKA